MSPGVSLLRTSGHGLNGRVMAEERVQYVRHLPHKHDDLRSDPQSPWKARCGSPDAVSHISNPRTPEGRGGTETRISESSWTGYLVSNRESLFTVEDKD